MNGRSWAAGGRTAAAGRSRPPTTAPSPSSREGPPLLRPARPDEAAEITALCLRSKRLWGYSDEFMSLATAHMTITAADIERDLVEVLAASDRLLGFYRLQRRERCAWLEDLFIDPAVVRAGHGRRLLERACAVAREWGYATVEMVADPHAEAFYLHLGAARVGTVPSDVLPDRRLPLLRLGL